MGRVSEDTTVRRDAPRLVAGRYRVERPVGRGGMGTVWLATDERLGRRVALKRLAAVPGETDGRARALREARHAASLNHPNVVAIYDVAEDGGEPWLVMEYVDGPTLSQAVRARGPLHPRGAADLGAQLAAALAAAHAAGIIHRDIKPANVLIGDRRPKLADFGTARAGTDDQLTSTGMVTGTPTYMAPEVGDGGDPSPASDLWALGATLYYAVEGRPAYPPQANPLATLRLIATTYPARPQRAGALAPVIGRLMHRDPAQRGSAAQVRDVLRRMADGGSWAESPPATSGSTSAPAPGGPAPAGPPPAGPAAVGPYRGAVAGSSVRAPGRTGQGTRAPRRWVPVVVVLLVLLALLAVVAVLVVRP